MDGGDEEKAGGGGRGRVTVVDQEMACGGERGRVTVVDQEIAFGGEKGAGAGGGTIRTVRGRGGGGTGCARKINNAPMWGMRRKHGQPGHKHTGDV